MWEEYSNYVDFGDFITIFDKSGDLSKDVFQEKYLSVNTKPWMNDGTGEINITQVTRTKEEHETDYEDYECIKFTFDEFLQICKTFIELTEKGVICKLGE